MPSSKNTLVKHGFVKKSMSQILDLLQRRKRSLKKNNLKKSNQRRNKRRKKKKRMKKKMFTHSWQASKRKRILWILFQNLLSILMILREILLMLKISNKLSRDSGLLMTLKDGVFGNQTMNFTKEKAKSDI